MKVLKVSFNTFGSWLQCSKKPYAAKSIFGTKGMKLFALEESRGNMMRRLS
jgi:hypothetical protein